MAIAGALEIQMSANIARITDDMAKTKSIVTSAMGGVESAVASAKNALGALGIGLSGGMFVSFIEGGIKAQAQLHSLALQTGITVETLSALRPVAKQAGIDLDTAAGMVNKLEKNMLTFAQGGGGKAAAAFEQLGYTQEQVKVGLQNIDTFLPEFAKRLLAAGVGGEQAGLAMQLMAKGGAAALPFLDQLVKTGVLHAKVTTDQAAAAHEFEVSIVKLKESSSDLAISLANYFLPALNAITGAMIDAKKEGGALAAIWAGLKAITVGTEKFQAEKDLFNQVSAQLAQEATLARLRRDGYAEDTFAIITTQKKIAAAKDDIAQSRARVELLQHEQDIKDKANAKPPATPLVTPTVTPTAVAQIDTAYINLIKSIQEKIALDALELQGGDKLTEGQKIALKAMVDLRDGTLKLTDAQKINLAGKLEDLITADKALQASKDMTKAREEAAAAAEKESQAAGAAQVATLTGLADEIAKIKEHNAEIGKTKEQIDTLKAAEQDRAVSALQADLAIATSEQADQGNQSAYIAFLNTQIALIKEKQGLLVIGAAAEAQAAEARKTQESWNKTWTSIEQVGKLAFVNVLSNGRNAFQSIGIAIKASVIDLLYELTAKKWIISIGTSLAGTLGMSTAASAAATPGGAAGSSLSSLSSMSSIGSMFSKGATGVTGMANGVFQDLGTSMGSQWIADIGNYGFGLPFISGLVMAATGNVAGGIGSTLGGIAGSYFGPIGTMVGSTLGGMIGSMLGGGGSSRQANDVGNYLTGSVSRGGLSGGGVTTLMGASPDDYWGGSRSNAIPTGALTVFNQSVAEVFASMEAQAKALNMDTSGLAAITVQAANSGKGAQQDMIDVLAKTSDTIATTLMPSIAALQQSGESLTQTFVRVTNAEIQAEAALAKVRQGWQDQLDVLTGARSQLQVERTNQLAEVTDAATIAIMNQVFAAQDQVTANEEAAAAQEKATQAAVQAAAAFDAIAAGINAKIDSIEATRQSWLEQAWILMGAVTQQQLDREKALASTTDGSTITWMNLVFSLQDAKAAAEEATKAQQDQAAATNATAADMARASDQLVSAWQSATDAILGEVNRLRGTAGGGSLAQMQAQFAISTAQARAGDLGAAQLLPGLSQSILDLAVKSAASSIDVQRISGQMAGSLQTTAAQTVARFGLNLPSDSNAALATEVKKLRIEMVGVRKAAQKTADLLTMVTQDGQSLQTTVV